VVDPSPEAVIAETKSVLAKLQLPAPKAEWAAVCRAAAGSGALTPDGFVPWPHPSFLGAEDAFAEWLPPDTEALYVAGAFTDGLAETLLASRRTHDVIVPSGTHLLAGREPLDRLLGRGGRFWALAPMRAVAITLNPTAPDGSHVEPGAFLTAFHGAFPLLPVVDVEAGRSL
jgi:hypothetical protein